MSSPSSLTFPVKFAYWFGQLAEGLKNSSFALLLLFYYNQVLGVPGSWCGIALFIATALDAFTDPMMGSISDGWRSPRGRRHPFMYASALPLAGCFMLLFNPLVEGPAALAVWLGIFSVATRLSMTLYHVPHLALGAEMSTDFDERTRIVAYRQVFGASGFIVVYGLGFGVFFAASEEFPNGQLNPEAYAPLTAILAGLMIVSIFYTAWGTRSLIPQLRTAANVGRVRMKDVFHDMVQALRNPSFRWLVVGFLAAALPVGAAGALALYLNTFFWELTPAEMPVVLIAGPIATLLGYLAAPKVMSMLDKKTTLILGVGLWAFFALIPIVLKLLGYFPAAGTLSALVTLSVFALLSGVAVAQLVVAVSSMMADIADEHELNTGKRQEGVFFGAFAFTNKAIGGAGAALGGIALDVIDWPTGENVRTAADIPADTLFALAIVAGPVVAVGIVPALILVSFYSISRARHGEIRRALLARQAEAAG